MLAAATLAQTTAEEIAAAAGAKVDEAERQTSCFRLQVEDLTCDNERLKTERGELESKLIKLTGLAERMKADLDRQTSGRNSSACAASSAESSSSSSDSESDSGSGQAQADRAAIAVEQATMLTDFTCRSRSMYDSNVESLGADAAGLIRRDSIARYRESEHARAVALASRAKRQLRKSHAKKTSKGKRKKEKKSKKRRK